MKINIKHYLLIFFFLLSFKIVISAQDTTSTSQLFDLSLQELLNVKVVTSAKSEQKAWEASAMVVVITQSMIKERGYSDLFDALNSLPYFQIQSEHGHWTKGGIVNLRGHRSGDSGNNKVLLLVDGIKISDDAEEGLYMGLNSIPLNAVKQIEIVYGPNSTLYGRDAYAGMINLITVDEDKNYAGYSYGSFNTHKYYAGLFHEFDENVSASFNLFSYKSDEQNPTDKSIVYLQRHYFPKPPYTERFYRASDNRAINLGINFHGLSLKYILYDIIGSESYGSNPDLYVAEYSTLIRIKNQVLSAEYNFEFNSNLNAEFYYNYKQNEFDPQTANLYVDDLNRTGTADYPDAKEINSLLFPDTTITVDPFHAYGGRKYYYFRTRAHKFGFKTTYEISPTLKNVSGVDYNWVWGIPVISEGKGGKPITTDEQREKLEHDFGTAGFYTEFSYNINPNLLITAGGRLDINSEYENTFVPRFALIHSFDNNIFKLIFSKGYLAPSITQAYFESITTFSWIRKNENLKPEKNTSVELDWTYSKESFNLSANLFYNNLSNSIIESVTTGDSTWTYVGINSFYVPILQSENVSDGYRYGLNLSLAKKLNNNLSLNFNYSLILGKDKIHNNETEINDNLISNHKINFGVQFTYNKYQIYAEAIWLGEKRIKSFHNSTPYSNLLDSEGYLNFDPVFLLNLNFRINDLYEGMSFYCNIKNALDNEYYGQTINAQWGSPVVLQDMRRINLGIEYDF
ncbi:MAG: hypothetical protein A2068_06110 [Ignavibacteria bacterium GWB2_35_6b]|nr:MAG: hypothetical protein A2068_06110 [Ignavibacteria bacterium GWB2_35_6b]